MKYLPLCLIICCLSMTVYVIYFRLVTTRRFDSMREQFLSDTSHNVALMITNALHKIDSYFLDRQNQFSSATSSVAASSNSLPVSSSSPVRLDCFGDWQYHFYFVDGIPCARSGIYNFRVGDVHPYGGVITFITPDSVQVDGIGYYRNTLRGVGDVVYASTTPSVSEVFKNVGTVDNLRK